jgi:phosphoglycolate phosphatase-like HAD superfamily hydrolase
MEKLGIDSILDGDELSSMLFGNESVTEEDTKDTDEGNDVTENPHNEKDIDTAEIDPDSLFGISESVGSEDNKDSKEDTTTKESGTSPNFFSSIATAFAEEGIFPDLDDKAIKEIKDAQSFRAAIDNQIKAGLDEQQKRVIEALDNGVEPDQIRQHENLIAWLDSQKKNIAVEGDAGDDLRRRIIMQDYINKGFKEERAKQKVDKIFEEGSEIEEAEEALQSLYQHYSDNYKKILKEAKDKAIEDEEERKQASARIKKNILEDKDKLFGEVEIDKNVRQKAFDAVSKPIYKDPKTGDTYTALQKLELDNREEFISKLGLLYALTDGFTSINKLVDTKVKKEIKKGFSDLERKINTTARNSHGNLDFISGTNDENSFIGKGIKLDI